MNLKKGSVLFPANKIFNTQYGEKQTIKIKFQDGVEETIWCKVGQKPHTELKKGDVVQVLYEEKNGKQTKRLIVDNDGSTSQMTPSSNNNTQKISLSSELALRPEEKSMIAEYVRNSADLYAFCLKTVKEKMNLANGVDAPLINDDNGCRAVATSLFIATQKKFNL